MQLRTVQTSTGKRKQKFNATAGVYGEVESTFQFPAILWMWNPACSLRLDGFKFYSKAVSLRNCSFSKREILTVPGTWLDLATQAHVLWATISCGQAAPPPPPPQTLGRRVADPSPHSMSDPQWLVLCLVPQSGGTCNPSFEKLQNTNDKTPNLQGYQN